MKNHGPDQDTLLSQLKHLIADMFRIDIIEPDKIADDEPLIGGSLGLNHLDALELAICIEERFGVKICTLEESHHAFGSVTILADFIHARVKTNLARSRHVAATRITRRVLTLPPPVLDEVPAAVGP